MDLSINVDRTVYRHGPICEVCCHIMVMNDRFKADDLEERGKIFY